MSTRAGTVQTGTPARLVDLTRYPVLAPESDRYGEVVAAGREQLAAQGAAELSGFVSAVGLDALISDAVSLEVRSHPSRGLGSAYLEPPDSAWPADHPRRQLGEYSLGAVAYDVIPHHSPLRQLYEWPPVQQLVAAILDRGPLFPYADPFGALNLAVMGDGDQLQWHFDQTDFVVSLAIQRARSGGDFEVAPRLRQAADERYDDVARVLRGDDSRVITLPMTPGTLLIFEGRHSLHRVSPIRGETTRLVGLLAYDTKPGTVGSDALRQVRYGRTTPYPEPPDRWSDSMPGPGG